MKKNTIKEISLKQTNINNCIVLKKIYILAFVKIKRGDTLAKSNYKTEDVYKWVAALLLWLFIILGGVYNQLSIALIGFGVALSYLMLYKQ